MVTPPEMRESERDEAEFTDDEFDSFSEAVSGTGGAAVFCSAILVPFEIRLHTFFGDANGARERDLCEVVIVETGDVLLVGGGDQLLRLDHLDGVGYTCAETVASLCESLFGQIYITARNVDLFCGGIQVEECCAHVGINLRPQILLAIARLLEASVSLQNIAVNAAPQKDWNAEGALDVVHGCSGRRMRAGRTVISTTRKGRHRTCSS